MGSQYVHIQQKDGGVVRMKLTGQQHLPATGNDVMKTPSSKNFPSSNSLKAAGMTGISPIALQQGLTMHNATKTDQQPALVHPSLQGELFPKNSASGNGASQKKKPRSRKKAESDDSNIITSKPRPKP